MKKYSKPVAEIEIFDSTDIITLSGVGEQGILDPDTAEALGIEFND